MHDGDTGLILKSNTLPTGDARLEDVSFKHVTIALDGTLILKDQARPAGETGQGSMAAIKGLQAGLKMANSEIVAVDPNTLDILDAAPVPEAAASPHIITTFDGKSAIYVSGSTHLYRYFWDPKAKKLSADRSRAVSYLNPGESTGTAPSVMDDWIVVLTNSIGSKTVASRVVAVNQKDPAKLTSIRPFGPLQSGQISFAPPKNGTDIENNMVYAADMGMGKVAGIKLDQATGEMRTAFVAEDTTSGLQTVIGPKDKRVLIGSNVHHDFPFEGTMLELMTHLYKEQVTWRDAATGHILAASDFFEPIPNALLTPGFGGRTYYVTNDGFLVLQVRETTP
jgi:hypothetical protein